MTQQQPQRVAPLIALLVIILGISLIVGIPFLAPLFTQSAPTTEQATVATTSPTATPTFAFSSEYDFHRSRDELMVALYHIETTANQAGWTAQDHIRAGNLWRDMGDLASALPHWEAANAIDPNPNVLRQIAIIYLARGEWTIAYDRIQTLLDLSPNDVWALYHGGMILAPSDPVTAFGYLARVGAMGDDSLSETAQTIANVIAETETSAEIVIQVGLALTNAEEWSLAENAFQYAADLYYPFPEATAYVGLMRVLQGKNGDSAINEALALSTDNANIHYLAGVYWRASGEFGLSEDNFITAILLDAGNPTFYAELGNTYRAMGNRLEAEIWLQTAVLVSDNDPIFVTALDEFYQDETLLVAEPLLAFSQATTGADDPAVISANGWALHLQGDSDGGLMLVENALAIDPDNPRGLFDKARILIALERLPEAIPILEDLAEGDSVFADPAQSILEQYSE